MSVQKIAASVTRQTNAVVISAGLMEKTVKVRVGVQKWNKHIGKHFNQSRTILVHDPRSSLRIGDVISISPGWRASKQVHHVVNSILAPFGEPIEARLPVPTAEERIAERDAKKKMKEQRRRAERKGKSIGSEIKTEVQEVKREKGGEEVQMRSEKGTETAISEREEGIEEVKDEEEVQRPKSWWRI